MAFSPIRERLKSKMRTARAMALLARARLTVAVIPFERWRDGLGTTVVRGALRTPPDRLREAQTLAAHMERAARWVPFEAKCLPRAVALSWQLRRRSIPHEVVFAVRPAPARDLSDNLHASVDVEGSRILGDLPGPWLETLRLGV